MDFQFSEYISPVLRSGRSWCRKRCFLGQCTWCRGWRCIFTTRGVYSKNWRVMTIQKQIMREHCHFTNVAIRINKPPPPRIIVPTPQIVQPHLLIKHIPAIPKRLHLAQRFRQLTSTPQRRAPRIVAVADDGIAILIQNRNNIALQVLNIRIRHAVVHHHCWTVLRVIEEMQLIRTRSHMHNILAVQCVLRHHAVDRFLHTQAVCVVHKFSRHARFLHLLQLPAVLPSVRPRPVVQRIANRIIANCAAVDRRELVAPVRVAVFVGNSFQRVVVSAYAKRSFFKMLPPRS